jgi:hypothetical protein
MSQYFSFRLEGRKIPDLSLTFLTFLTFSWQISFQCLFAGPGGPMISKSAPLKYECGLAITETVLIF